MKKMTLFLLTLSLALAGPATATIVNFDTINTQGNDAVIPVNYAGFTWDANFSALHNTYYNLDWDNTITFPSSPNVAFNGPNAAFNAYGTLTVSVSHPLFNLVGASFSCWADKNDFNKDFSSPGLTVDGYKAGNLVGSIHFDLSTIFAYHDLSLLANIDEVRFTTDGGEQHWWLMDNLTFIAPLPGTVILLGSGLLGLLGWRRKF